MKPDLKNWGLRRPSAVILVAGAPGTGKTLLCYNLADALRGERKVFCPMSQRFNRPKYYRRLTPQLFSNCVRMETDASMTYHAREFMTGKNVGLDKIQNVRRHHNIDFIWDVQNTGSLDIEILRSTDCLILKEDSALQKDFERPAIRNKYLISYEEMGAPESVRVEMPEFKPSEWDVTNAYVFTHKKVFRLEGIEVPSYWNESISVDDLSRKPKLWTKLDIF